MPQEKMNWNQRKSISDHRGSDDKPKVPKWDPRELQKARAARKAWEAEKARTTGEH